MQFLFPYFLWALLLLAVPVIIHLFYFRRFRKVYFTNVKFLKEVKDESSARNKLKHWLVLLMRLLALAFLIFAFAQPFIPLNKNIRQGRKAVSVFIDNSFSMNAKSQDVTLLEKAKNRAREIFEAYEQSDQFQIITNDFEGRHQRLLNRDDVISLINEINASPAVRDLSQVTSRQIQLLDKQEDLTKVIYLVSDFQERILDLPTNIDTSYEVNLLPIQSVQEKNISIDSCWFAGPVHLIQQNNPLFLKITNYSAQDAENVRISIVRNGQEQPHGSINIAGNSSVTDTINIQSFTTGWQDIEVKISDFPVTFDDHFYLSYEVAQQINVLSLYQNQPNPYVNSVLAGLDNFAIVNQSVQNVQYASFSDYSLILLDELDNISSGLAGELKQYLAEGGNVTIFPSRNIDLNSYNNFIRSVNGFPYSPGVEQEHQVTRINTDEFIFNEVFERIRPNLRLPLTTFNYNLTASSNIGAEHLLTYRDGRMFVGKFRVGNGFLYLSASPLQVEYSNLVNNPEIFVPMIFKMALANVQQKKTSYWVRQGEQIILENQARGSDMVYRVKGANKEWIPRQVSGGSVMYLDLDDQIAESGFYQVSWSDNIVAHLAFNYNRQESDLSVRSLTDLTNQYSPTYSIIDETSIADFAKYLQDKNTGISLWKYCILLTLFFLIGEILLLRFWRT